jgi:ribosomal protein S18 acetylase RimI-like enzyme
MPIPITLADLPRLEPRGQGRAEIMTLATARAERNKGYAKALLLELFASTSFKTVSLKVEVNNLAAVKLYKGVGFLAKDDAAESWWYCPLEL